MLLMPSSSTVTFARLAKNSRPIRWGYGLSVQTGSVDSCSRVTTRANDASVNEAVDQLPDLERTPREDDQISYLERAGSVEAVLSFQHRGLPSPDAVLNTAPPIVSGRSRALADVHITDPRHLVTSECVTHWRYSPTTNG